MILLFYYQINHFLIISDILFLTIGWIILDNYKDYSHCFEYLGFLQRFKNSKKILYFLGNKRERKGKK